MTAFRLLLAVPLVALGASLALPVRSGPADRPSERPAVVELRWPDGGLRERRQVEYLADGTMVDHGTFERWYPDGTKEYEAVFVHGRKEGVTVRYHDNGRVASRQHYRDGRRHGASVSWDRDGRRVKEEHWSDGRPDGVWTVWDDGRVEWTHRFDDGDPDPRGTR